MHELGDLCQDPSILQTSGASLERREKMVFLTKLRQINREQLRCTNAMGHDDCTLVNRLFVDLIQPKITLPKHSLNAD